MNFGQNWVSYRWHIVFIVCFVVDNAAVVVHVVVIVVHVVVDPRNLPLKLGKNGVRNSRDKNKT